MLNKFLNEDPTMNDTREHKFLLDSMEAIKENNAENFKAAW